MKNYSEYPNEVKGNGYLLVKDRPFFYTVQWVGLAAAAANPTPMTVNLLADQDFFWTGCSFIADIALAAQTDSAIVIPLVTVQFILAGEPFQDSEYPITQIASGPNREPKPLPCPVWLPGASSFTINARNYSAATVYNLWFTLIGIKYKRVGTAAG